jgi:hypothetical protein
MENTAILAHLLTFALLPQKLQDLWTRCTVHDICVLTFPTALLWNNYCSKKYVVTNAG